MDTLRIKPYSISSFTELYFCTDTVVGWQNVFTSPDSFDIITKSLDHCRKEKGLRIHGYVIMPNHAHIILSARDGNLSDILRDFKRFTSTEISQMLQSMNNQRLLKYFSIAARRVGKGNTFKIWQSGSHPEAISTREFFYQKLNYMHDNPVRKGYVARPEHWLYSSARNYLLDDQSILLVDMVE
jgi:putative transposase